MNTPKPKRRGGIATAKTSGLAEPFRRKTREKKEKLEEELEVKRRAREERLRVFQGAGLEYFSDDDDKLSEGEEDEYIEVFVPEPATQETLKQDMVIKKQGDKIIKKVTFEEPEVEEMVEAKFDFNDPIYDYDNMFIPIELPPNKSDKNKTDNSLEEDKVPIRCTLYRSKDPRSGGPNAILHCKICLEHGKMYLFSSEDTLKLHLTAEHASTMDWIRNFC